MLPCASLCHYTLHSKRKINHQPRPKKQPLVPPSPNHSFHDAAWAGTPGQPPKISSQGKTCLPKWCPGTYKTVQGFVSLVSLDCWLSDLSGPQQLNPSAQMSSSQSGIYKCSDSVKNKGFIRVPQKQTDRCGFIVSICTSRQLSWPQLAGGFSFEHEFLWVPFKKVLI